MPDLDATSSHVKYNLGPAAVTAAAAHLPEKQSHSEPSHTKLNGIQSIFVKRKNKNILQHHITLPYSGYQCAE